jgi:hypothetical protein
MSSSSHSSKDAFRLRPLEPLTIDDWTFHHRVAMRTLGIYQAFKEDRPAKDEAKLRGFLIARAIVQSASRESAGLPGPSQEEAASLGPPQ